MLIRNLWITVFLFSLLTAGEWVKYGWQLYDQPGDARILALGGAQVTNGTHVASVLVNPANNDFGVGSWLSYAHQSRFAGLVEHDFFAFSIKRGFARPVHVVILQEFVGGIPNTTNGLLDWGNDGIPGTGDAGEGDGILDEGERLDASKISQFHQQQWGLFLSSTWKRNNWTFGVGFKGLFHSIGHHYANGIGFNIGARRSLWKTLSIGFSVSDVTTSWLVWENGTIERALPVISTGLSGEFSLPILRWKSTFYSDIIFDTNGDMLDNSFSSGRARFGLEVAPKSALRLRGGLSEINMITGGIGVVSNNWTVDYSFKPSPLGSSLGSSHYLTFNVSPQWVFGLLGVSY